jgi:hypothetical protein
VAKMKAGGGIKNPKKAFCINFCRESEKNNFENLQQIFEIFLKSENFK